MAPMPFVVGMLRSSLPELRKYSKNIEEDVIVVDVENNKFIASEETRDCRLVAKPYYQPLLDTLEQSCKRVKEKYSRLKNWKVKARNPRENQAGTNENQLDRAETQDVANAFIGFMVLNSNPQPLSLFRIKFFFLFFKRWTCWLHIVLSSALSLYLTRRPTLGGQMKD